jgi:UDP-N-acetylmuramate dehydrogenase
MEISSQASLGQFNTFGVTSHAAHFAEVTSTEQLKAALEFGDSNNLPIQILGGGSNVLFVLDFPGLVIRIASSGCEQISTEGEIKVAAGENWHYLVRSCLRNELHGLENLALIPGTVGGAPIQNIGAYGVEIAQFISEVEVLELETGKIRLFTRKECEFAYRDSIFKNQLSNQIVVLSVSFQLNQGRPPNISYPSLYEAIEIELTKISGGPEVTPQLIFDTVCRIRRAKLPDPAVIGNAGSFFKNPVVSQSKHDQLRNQFPDLPSFSISDTDLVKIPAAWLLDQAGWRGRSRGAAGVHKDHALVLVNLGEATGEEILLLAQEMSQSTLDRYGIALETEVRII